MRTPGLSLDIFCGEDGPCFDNHHTGSKHEHAASTGAGDESVFCVCKACNMVQLRELGRVAFAGALICFTD